MKDNLSEIAIEYFKKSHKIEKQMGTVVVIVMIIAALLLFPLKITITYTLICLLIYFKFLYDIKQKFKKTISELEKEI